ncbi:MAG: hypothetical protein ACLFS4_05560, partial [Opitutales bacterium]
MQLLNLKFAILVIKIAICVLPAVFGLYLILSREDSKRELRSFVCNLLFGVSNAFEFKKFSRFLYVLGVLLLLFSLAATWFLLIWPELPES